MSVNGNVTGTTAANFIPELWGDPIPDFAQRAKRLISRVRDVSDLVPQGISRGDIIHIPRVSEESVQNVTANQALTFKTNTDPKTDLTIDQHKAVPKRIEDLATVQANVSLLETYLSSMVFAWVKNAETFVADLLQTATAHDVSLATDNQMTAAEFRQAETNLEDEDYDVDEMNARGEMWLYANPAIKSFLKGLGLFTDWDKTGVQPGTGVTGRIPVVYGTPLQSSADWDSVGTAGEEGATYFSKMALMFAMQQDMKVESTRALAGGFLADIVVVSGLYGAALSYPVADATGPIVNFNNP